MKIPHCIVHLMTLFTFKKKKKEKKNNDWYRKMKKVILESGKFCFVVNFLFEC